LGANGCPLIPEAAMPSGGWTIVIAGGSQLCILGFGQKIDALSALLERYVHGPVANGTGLTGKYDISLGFLPDGMATAERGSQPQPPTLSAALFDQLGLRLAQIRGTLDDMVVDQCNKMPMSN
ncbi:MAG TPA: TIGR03435 family protein, partial [Terriglobales bacterium]